MNHQEAACRRSACAAALRTVLEDSVVAEALWELERYFQAVEAQGLSISPDLQDPALQWVLKDLGRNYLLNERALQRLGDAMTRAWRADPDLLPEDPWVEMQAQRGVRPVRQPARSEKEQYWHHMTIHTFQILWHTSWHGRVLYKARQWLYALDQWLLRRMEENYGRSG
ncbi:hypothetical protein [Leptothrix ochracea]|uniref:hypothetical protein n=1 Tax=Leptothrix ochracea TaxID=735331 RepID=UPI0034E2C02A